MQGLALARAYFQQILCPLIADHRPALASDLAAGLLGWGSDVLGHDDAHSRDHEWGPRCLIFLPQERIGEAAELMALLDERVPPTFLGYPTRFAPHPSDPQVRVPSTSGAGSLHIEITTCEAFWRHALGVVEPESELDWLAMSEHRLLELTRGQVFCDGPGLLTRLRALYAYYPQEVWLYRLAFAWQALGWDADLIGLTAARGDSLSARQALNTCLDWVVQLIFLLNRAYAPRYLKWVHRELLRLPQLARRLAHRTEALYATYDLAQAPSGLAALCRELLAHQGELGLAPQEELGEPPHGRGFFPLYLQLVADQLHASIQGPLKERPLVGAADQWARQYDLLMDAERLRAITFASLGEPLP